MKLNLSLRKGTQKIIFTNPIRTNVHSYLKVNKAKIIWTVRNVGIGEKIQIDSTDYPVLEGYYSFEDLKTFLENLGNTVALEKSEKCSITPEIGKTLKLKNVGQLLGFNKNVEIDAKETSPYIVNVHGGLSYLSFFCDKVNSLENYNMHTRSELVCTVLVPEGTLNGITSESSIETRCPLENGSHSVFSFTLTDNSFLTDKDSYTVLLDCEIY